MLDDLEVVDAKQPIENPDEIKIDDSADFDVEPSTPAKGVEPSVPINPESPSDVPEHLSIHHETRFLALDKCLPRREFLEVGTFP